ncbi:MAG: vWA domain-containing protein [Planctomycetota bacterium]
MKRNNLELRKTLLGLAMLLVLLIISTAWIAEPEKVIIYLKDSAILDEAENYSDKPVSPNTSARKPGETISVIPEILDSIGQRLLSYPDKELSIAWIIDDSGSMKDERKIISNEIDNFMSVLNNKKILNMAVVGFGEKARICCELTRDSKMIKKGIMDVGNEGSGIENCMAAIEYSIKTVINATGKRVLILVTDETGDDTDRLEQIIPRLKNKDIAVYVLGRESSFIHPEAPDNNGIESADPELLVESKYVESDYSPVPFYLPTDIRYYIKSGFPPYALARICKETKGYYYFLKDSIYDKEIMKLYKPDLCSVEEYRTMNQKDKLRSVIMGITYKQNSLFSHYYNTNTNDFWCNDASNFFETPLIPKKGLIQATKSLPIINDCIKQLETAISSDLMKTANKRWIANAELMMAQLYRVAFLLDQYVLTLDEWIKSKDFFNPPLAVETSTNYNEYYYIGQDTDAPIRKGSDAKDYKNLAEQSLEKVILNHPGTPWSVVAWAYKKEGMYGYKVFRINPKKENNLDKKLIPPKKH